MNLNNLKIKKITITRYGKKFCFKIMMTDFKIFTTYWQAYKYIENIKTLKILNTHKLPILLEIDKEYIINLKENVNKLNN